MANFLVGEGVMPLLNAYGKVGFPVPYLSSSIIKLRDTEVVYLDGYLIVNTDFAFNPSLLTE
jgi:hypothetical protein